MILSLVASLQDEEGEAAVQLRGCQNAFVKTPHWHFARTKKKSESNVASVVGGNCVPRTTVDLLLSLNTRNQNLTLF